MKENSLEHEFKSFIPPVQMNPLCETQTEYDIIHGLLLQKDFTAIWNIVFLVTKENNLLWSHFFTPIAEQRHVLQ